MQIQNTATPVNLLKRHNMSKWHGGKGSKTRPTDKQAYDDNFDAIFGKKKKEADKPKNKDKK
jgi:hypothetical protein